MKTLSMLSLFLCFATAGFAEEPTKSADKPAATESAAPAASSAPSAAAAKQTADADAETKKMRSMGFKPKHAGNQTLWCKKETKTGSRFETESCMTAEAAIAQQQQAKELVERAQHTVTPISN